MSRFTICEHGYADIDQTCPACWGEDETMSYQTQADRAVVAEAVLDAIRREYTRARRKHAPLNSGHEAVGVIDEEFVEFKDAVYFGVDRHGRPANPQHEAIQIAAMALAYVVEAYETWEFFATEEPEEPKP